MAQVKEQESQVMRDTVLSSAAKIVDTVSPMNDATPRNKSYKALAGLLKSVNESRFSTTLCDIFMEGRDLIQSKELWAQCCKIENNAVAQSQVTQD